MCDLLLEAAQLFSEPAGGLTTGGAAVAITAGRLVASGPATSLPPELVRGAKRRLRLRAATATLSPGLIEMHAHIDPTGGHPGPGGLDSGGLTPRAGRISRYGVDPDRTYIPRGVTTVLSQGDAGALTWDAYAAASADCQTRCLMAMNILNVGEDPAYFPDDPRWVPRGPLVVTTLSNPTLARFTL